MAGRKLCRALSRCRIQCGFYSTSRNRLDVNDEPVDAFVAAIVAAAQNGKVGDGKIFVGLIEQVVFIRTSEEDHEAL